MVGLGFNAKLCWVGKTGTFFRDNRNTEEHIIRTTGSLIKSHTQVFSVRPHIKLDFPRSVENTDAGDNQ